MSYQRGPDRFQVQLLPVALDDYVCADAPVRFIDAYVESLDLKALNVTHAEPKFTGRPSYHPADMLKLYIYGYLNRIRSSRRLEAEAQRNLELIWLLRSIQPDFKTIADFRKDNCGVFKTLLRQFNLLCRSMGLFGAELVAIDGSKFKAVNNEYRNLTQEQLQQLIITVQTRIDHYVSELDRQDGETGVVPAKSQQPLKEKIALLQERKGRYEEWLGPLPQTGQKQVSLTDADARKMRGPHGYLVGYNVQVAVDAKHDLIAAQQVVTDGDDRKQLAEMSLAAQIELAAKQLKVTADKGYHETDQIEACEKAGIETYVAVPATPGGRTKNGEQVFPKERFKYDPKADVYHCPEGQMLPLATTSYRDGVTRKTYYSRRACRECPVKKQCTTIAYRAITRRANEVVLDRAAQRVVQCPELVKRRREIVEHVFGTLRNWGHDHFLMKGLAKVRGEFSLSALAYNLRRVLTLIPIAKLLQALKMA